MKASAPRPPAPGAATDKPLVPAIITAKTRRLLGNLSDACRRILAVATATSRILARRCESVPEIAAESVSLVVTSPPFLRVVNYAADNWLRCWFAGLDARSIALSIHGNVGT